MNINRQSSPEAKKEISDVVYQALSEALFDRVNFISHPFSQITTENPSTGVTTSGTTSSSSFVGVSRLTDTSEGKFLRPDRISRMKCQFYVTNADNLIAYVLSPTIYDSFTSLNSFASMDIFRGYVGIKISGGIVYAVAKNYKGGEQLVSSKIRISGTGSSTTYVLEVRYFVKRAEVYIDGVLIANFSLAMNEQELPVKTFLPFLAPVKSTNGSNVNIIVENYQFIQDK